MLSASGAAQDPATPLPPADTAHIAAAPSLQLVPTAEPPPLSPAAVQRIALSAFEVLEGSRAIAQLAGAVSLEVARQLRFLRALRTERRTLHRDARRIVASPGPPHLSSPREGVVDAAVVLHTPGRAYAVALRFELRSQHWRATHLTVL
ncbi:Rv3235 family protein [Leucobacter chromiireducens]|uniref:Rv3235 family protein n=1 Tax=Leucobacter chromiireducens TaxID=283877 RepID=UPI000F62E929|nr:Rv3235 family protein [Leucobacter chromiireducens]